MNDNNNTNQSEPTATEHDKMPRIGILRHDLEMLPGERDLNGNMTYLIFDPVADSYFRLTEKNHQILQRWTNTPTISEFVQKLQNSGINATEAEVIKLQIFLQQSGLLQISYLSSEAKIKQSLQFKQKMFFQILLSTYLFFRVPLWSPDKFLTRTSATVQKIFNRWTIWSLIVIISIGYLSLIVNYHRFADAFVKSISIQGMVRYSLAVVFIKILHEFSHAYTAKLLNCRVRRMGVAVVFFFPRFYTDLTDSWRINNRRKRFFIDGAGIFSEIAIGGIAAIIWSFSQAGTINSIAYYIFAVSIINTVFINGNPFIRYDGYYMLMDLLNVDNLQKRSTELIKNLWRKYLIGLKNIPRSDITSARLRYTLIVYGISAFIYRIFLYTSIILIVYFNFTKTIGIVLLCLEVYLLIIKPFYDEGKFIFMNHKYLFNKNFILSLSGVILLLLLLILPLPWQIAAPCEVKPQESFMVYASYNGFLEELSPQDGAKVKQGDLVFKQQNIFLDWNLNSAEIERAINLTELDQAQVTPNQLSESDIIRKTIQISQSQIAELERKKNLLELRSPIDGIFVQYDITLKAGKWLNRGDLLGEIFSPDKKVIIAYINEDDMKNINLKDKVNIVLNGEINSLNGKIIRIRQLPSGVKIPISPLLSVAGGPITGYVNEEGIFITNEAYFELLIQPQEDSQLPIGRSGNIYLRKYSSIAANMIKKTVQTLRRELSF